MSEKDKIARREATAEYYATHGIDEGAEDGDEDEVEVSKPLSVVLSVRLDSATMKRLGRLAKAHGVGQTTMARILVNRGLDDHLETESRATQWEYDVLEIPEEQENLIAWLRAKGMSEWELIHINALPGFKADTIERSQFFGFLKRRLDPTREDASESRGPTEVASKRKK